MTTGAVMTSGLMMAPMPADSEVATIAMAVAILEVDHQAAVAEAEALWELVVAVAHLDPVLTMLVSKNCP